MPAQSSPTDFTSTTLLKECSKLFSAVIARLTNLTFSEGSYPSRFKVEQISPWLKKPRLDSGDPARPILNLNSIGKVLKQLFLAWLFPHVCSLYCPLQSAYRCNHSTEIALLKISNDIFEAVDASIVTVLVALDLLAAFDMIDHSVLISRLEHMIGLGNWRSNGSGPISASETALLKLVKRDLGWLL